MKERTARRIAERTRMEAFTLIRPDSFGYDAKVVHRNKSTGQVFVKGHMDDVKHIIQMENVGEKTDLEREVEFLKTRLFETNRLLDKYETIIPLLKSIEGTGESMIGYVVSHRNASLTKRNSKTIEKDSDAEVTESEPAP